MISFMTLYMCQVSPDGNCAYVHWDLLRITQSQSDEPSNLRGSPSPTTRHRCTMSQCIRHLAVPGGHPIMNRARRCLTSVIQYKPLSERRIQRLVPRWATVFDAGPTWNQHWWIRHTDILLTVITDLFVIVIMVMREIYVHVYTRMLIW